MHFAFVLSGSGECVPGAAKTGQVTAGREEISGEPVATRAVSHPTRLRPAARAADPGLEQLENAAGLFRL